MTRDTGDPPTGPLLARTRATLDALHPSERRVAEVVLGFPGQLASYSASEIARLANVSNATVSRLVRRLGYASFEEARQAARAEQQAGAALFRIGVGADGEGQDDAIRRHLAQSRHNLDRTLKAAAPAAIDDLAQAILGAPRLRTFGFRSAQPLARYLAWQVMQVVPDAATMPRDGETLAEGLASLGPGDCAILIALRRAPRGLDRLADAMGRCGVAVAVIGDVPDLRALPGRWHLACETGAAGPLLNHTGAMALLNLLAARVVEFAGPEGRKRLGAIEQLHGELDEL